MPPQIRVTWFAVTAFAASLATIALIAPLTGGSFRLQAETTAEKPEATGKRGVNRSSLPLAFERNAGQHEPRLRYTARGDGYVLGLTNRGLDVALSNSNAHFSMAFRDANPSPLISAESPLGGHANYFIGSDAARWHTGVPLFGRVRYEAVWPGIDTIFYGNKATAGL